MGSAAQQRAMNQTTAQASAPTTAQAAQLPLKLHFRPALERGDFRVASSNAEAAAFIDRWPDWPSRSVGLVGPERCGKSHLAAVWRLRSNATLLEAAELQENRLPQLLSGGAVVLEGLERMPQEAEICLFHLLNLVVEQRAWLLLTMRQGADVWEHAMPDLRSRLRAMPMVALHPPDDVLLQWVLEKLLADRHIRAEEGLIPYLAVRMERSWKAAEAMVETLDYASLCGRRRVGVALARELLQQSGEDAAAPSHAAQGRVRGEQENRDKRP